MELEPPGIVPPDEDPHPGSDPIVGRIEQALDDGLLDEALALAEEALAAGHPRPLDLHFLAGDALLALGDPAGAEARFRLVLDQEPDCPSSRCWLAMALFRQCRFEAAEREIGAALALPDATIDAQVVHGLLLERRGRYAEADAAFRIAAEADGERYPMPLRLSRKEFDRELRKAIRRLPKEFRRHLDRLPVVVQDVPADHLLLAPDGSGCHDPDLLGLFDGIPLTESGDGLSGEVPRPSYIYLFQRNLERVAQDRDQLVEEIAITIYHELGHYLGMDEDDLDRIGLG